MAKDIPGVVYALVDPRDGTIRYVGKTQRDVARRIYLHIYDAKGNRRKTHTEAWLRGLLQLDLRPVVCILGAADSAASLNRLECFWIAFLRKSGASLTNATDGGEGVVNPSAAARAKMSVASRSRAIGRPSPMKGRTHTSEARAKISAAGRGRPSPMKGKKHSPAAIANMSAAFKGRTAWNKGLKATPEIREALRAGAAKRGPRPPCSEETKRKISEAKRRNNAKRRVGDAVIRDGESS